MPYPDEKNITTKEKVIRWCEITGADTQLELDIDDVILRVSSFISLQISKNGAWLNRSISETYDGNGQTVLALKVQPVTSITSLSILGVPIAPSTSFSVPGYRLKDNFITLNGLRFEYGTDAVAVEYEAGILPTDFHFNVLEQAALEAINFKWRRKAHPDQTAGKTGQGFVNEQFLEDDFPKEFWTAIKLLRSRITPIYVS